LRIEVRRKVSEVGRRNGFERLEGWGRRDQGWRRVGRRER